MHDLLGNNDIVKSNILSFKDADVGMVCNQQLLYSNLEGSNSDNIQEICALLDIDYNLVKDGSFIGGSMFMSRTDLFQKSFGKCKKNKILNLLKHEINKIDDTNRGTYTHAMERLFGYIVKYNKLTFNYPKHTYVILNNLKAKNGRLHLIELYNNDCYLLEDINAYGKILTKTNDTKLIEWLHLEPCVKQSYIQLSNNIFNKISKRSDIQDFDEQFYLSEYPDTRLYHSNTSLSLRHRMLDHYIKYGKNEGRCKNYSQLSNILIDETNDIVKNIKNKDISCPSNSLECICLLTTSKEIRNKKYQKFIRHLCKMTDLSKHTKKLHFKIILNNNQYIPEINNLKKIFKTVEIVNLNLSPDDDIYLPSLPHNKTMPVHGLKSGPNLCFFRTIQYCANYNTTLLLETDCVLGVDWIEKIMNYIRYANGFLISGAVYDGESDYKSNSIMSTHINGGTGIYSTGNKILQSLIKTLEERVKEEVSKDMIGLAYDYALKAMIDNNNDRDDLSPVCKKIWRFIKRNYLPNKLIINCSTANDNRLSKTHLKKIHNYAILHKK